MHTTLKKNIRKHLKVLPTAKELARDALKGKAKKGWYARATKLIFAYAPENPSLFIDILASTSPRQKVSKNLEMTIKIYNLLLGKEITEPLVIEAMELSDLPARALNVKRSIYKEKLSGPKVTAFKENLSGNLEHVTIDTWMITYSGIVNDNVASTKSGYLAYSHRVKKASKLLGWKPAEVQECIWSYVYAKVNKCDINDVPEFDIPDFIC